MKALIYQGQGRWVVEDRPVPEINASKDAIVKVTKTTILGTDPHILEGDVATSEPGSLETILVVDDNAAVLRTVVEILQRGNFVVLSATGGEDAIKLSGETEGKIDLLLSDVEMPGLSGPDLGQTLRATRPDLRVMLMSGGAQGNLLVLNYGWAYIQKPFLAVKLIEMVTEVLHAPDRSQPGGHGFDSRKG